MLAVSGSVLGFFSSTVHLGIVGNVLLLASIPPPQWLGTDYTDPRGAAVCFATELAFLGMTYFGAGRAFSRRFEFRAGWDGFWLCNPLSTATGVLTSYILMRNHVRPESASGMWTFVLILIGWPILWHLAGVGVRRGTWIRAVLVAGAYTVPLLASAIVQTYRVYRFE